MAFFEIKNLAVEVEDKEILKDINLSIERGETHVLMGPNGAGKSTLLHAIMDNPVYEVTAGDILLDGESLLDLSTDKRAKKGIFMSFQHPEAVPGITVENFLRAAIEELKGEKPSLLGFHKELVAKMAELDMDESYASRYLNVGFSGGEKKKDEILQLNVLQPQLALLDETDSGLDVDAVQVVSRGIKNFRSKDNSLLIITHHRAILNEIDIDRVHILLDGRIALSGGREVFERVQDEGFGWIREQADIELSEEALRQVAAESEA
ncbi:MAG: Fe-S cluster assembly ATPase SufC [Eubacteriales bacterium]|nr:Fe-S cluster assembly ATPase SufC [Eubacteriales bacterium]